MGLALVSAHSTSSLLLLKQLSKVHLFKYYIGYNLEIFELYLRLLTFETQHLVAIVMNHISRFYIQT